MATYYIQRKQGRELETVDETSNLKEARVYLKEYRISDPYAGYYISRRPCKTCKDK